jgi:hypothetical protein
LDAAAVQQRGAAAAGVVPRAEEAPQPAAEAVLGAAAGPRLAAAWVLSAASQPAARPSAEPSVFRLARALPSPVRRQVAQSARAMFVSQAASRSERSWQAARCEGLS